MKRKNRLVFIVLCILLSLSACTKKSDENKPSYDVAGKTYYNTVDIYGHEDHSWLWLGKDGSFVLNDSYKDGYKEISGSWDLNENVLTLSCDNGNKVRFEVKDDETLNLKSTLDGSKADDVFSIKEIKGSSVVIENSENNASQTDNNVSDSSAVTDNNTNEAEKREDVACTKITSLYHNYWCYEGVKDWDLQIRPLPENTTDKITFKSNDESVVTVDEKGRASAKGLGKTTIDVSCGTQKISVSFEVREKGPEGAGKAKTYKAKISDVLDSFQPSVFFDSGFFTFTENVYSGMAQYKGTYDIKDNYIYCTVTDASGMKGYAGQDVKEIVFKIVDDETIKLKTQLCMSGNGHLFYLLP